jgi:DNA polymerase-3 subunit beta
MTININKKQIKSIAKSINKILSKKREYEVDIELIYNNALRSLVIVANNEDAVCDFTIENLERDRFFACRINGIKFVNIIKATKTDIQLDIDNETGCLLITSNDTQFTLETTPAGYEAGSLEAITPDDMNSFTIDTQEFLNIIKMIEFSIYTTINRHNINTLLIDINKKKAVTTDGHRLSITDINLNNMQGDKKELLISKRDIEYIKTIFDKEEGELKICYYDKYHQKEAMNISNRNLSLSFDLVNARYPDYERVIPKDIVMEVLFDKKEIMNTLESCKTFYKGTKNCETTFKIKDGKCAIYVGDKDSLEYLKTIECETTLDNKQFVYNCFYLLDIFKVCKGERVKMQFEKDLNDIDNKIPLQGKCMVKDEGNIFLCMPILK